MPFKNNELAGKNDLLAKTRAKLNKRRRSGPRIFVAQAQMRGKQSVDEYLEKLTAKDRWAEIYKELVAQDEEYQQMVRDYLNDFHLHENDDEEPD